MTISEQLRRAIERDGRTVYALAKQAEVSPIQVWRFLRGERGLTTPVLDRLCRTLGLELKPKGGMKRGKSH